MNYIKTYFICLSLIAGFIPAEYLLSQAAPAGNAREGKDVGTEQAVNPETRIQYPVIRTRSIDLGYQVDLPPQKLNRVELWYIKGDKPSKEQKWQLYDFDSDKTPPVRFNAPGEGVYRFLIVAVDQYERRSIDHDASSIRSLSYIPNDIPPHLTVFVDYSKPQLYLQSPPPDMQGVKTGRLKLSWAGFDSHLSTNPVEIFYQSKSEKTWNRVCPPQPAIGDYYWQIPANIYGPIRIKMALKDRAGQAAMQISHWIDVSHSPSYSSEDNRFRSPSISAGELTQPVVKQVVSPNAKAVPQNAGNQSDGPPTEQTKPAKDEVMDFIQRGLLYERRKEWEKAADVYRAALEIESKNAQALMRSGYVHYNLGKFEQAETHFQNFLAIRKDDQNGLYGLILSQMALERYERARTSLKKLLSINEKDYEAWLLLGDVHQKLGQRQSAIENWLKAAQSESSIIIKLARERLETH